MEGVEFNPVEVQATEWQPGACKVTLHCKMEGRIVPSSSTPEGVRMVSPLAYPPDNPLLPLPPPPTPSLPPPPPLLQIPDTPGGYSKHSGGSCCVWVGGGGGSPLLWG